MALIPRQIEILFKFPIKALIRPAAIKMATLLTWQQILSGCTARL